MSYYRNNISHLFIIPALLTTALLQHHTLTTVQLLNICQQLLPLLEHELFLEPADLKQYIEQTLQFLQQQQLLDLTQQHYQCSKRPDKLAQLKLLAHNSHDILQRYAIVLNLLQQQQQIERSALELGSQHLAQRLLMMHGIDAPEYHDKQLFATLVNALNEAGYSTDSDDGRLKPASNFEPLLATVNGLVQPEVLQTIRQITADS